MLKSAREPYSHVSGELAAPVARRQFPRQKSQTCSKAFALLRIFRLQLLSVLFEARKVPRGSDRPMGAGNRRRECGARCIRQMKRSIQRSFSEYICAFAVRRTTRDECHRVSDGRGHRSDKSRPSAKSTRLTKRRGVSPIRVTFFGGCTWML